VVCAAAAAVAAAREAARQLQLCQLSVAAAGQLANASMGLHACKRCAAFVWPERRGRNVLLLLLSNALMIASAAVARAFVNTFVAAERREVVVWLSGADCGRILLNSG
jgi:hypothetical protein